MNLFPLFLAACLLINPPGQCQEQRIRISSGQDKLTATGENISWSLGEEGITISGTGLYSLAWQSWDEHGRWEIFAIGNFNISARQGVNLTEFFNETNENESEEAV